ncbi:right-handed parallel beta-helix repeat-containing protein [Rubrivirga marina]|uniref:Pel9A-like right handed beta-helix region domain-containing protein n=1 Tax=Rubrivirga marina TaxID=1196024 RepID=A0A271IXF3_9BACT|nr:right-handed parallel beta-helix repeat-containing protein [Rubrivirga marina]PAP75395.1 hypothetical protein BSZ37_02505 [Rubrivirga marina]
MRLVLLLALLLAAPASVAQSTYFVAPNGSALGSGAIGSPLTLPAALSRVAPGDTVYVRGGAYASSSSIRFQTSGADGAYVHVWAYPEDDERPVFDFTGASKGFDVQASYLHLKGITVENSNDNGIQLSGEAASHNIVEQMIARRNGDSGIQVNDGAAYNLLLNNDSYENYDAGNQGENADGFAVKFGVGEGNVLRGNRAWANSDDGYDFWSLDDPGQGGVLIEGNWAFRNGFNTWGVTGFNGDSNGFKLGKGEGPHTLIRNLAWDHRANGFDVNGNASGVTVYHNTAYLNRGVNFQFDDDPQIDEQAPYVLRNNASVAASVRMDPSVADDEANSWNAIVDLATPADFVSLDDTGADGPRGPDGSLPDLGGFLHLVEGSDLIDVGVDVGLEFAGTAPDLGAYEAGLVTAADDEPEAGIVLSHAGANPARGLTRVAVTLDASRVVRLTLHDALGREVAVVADGPLPGGRQTLAVDLAGLTPGVYVARLQAGDAVRALSLTVVR